MKPSLADTAYSSIPLPSSSTVAVGENEQQAAGSQTTVQSAGTSALPNLANTATQVQNLSSLKPNSTGSISSPFDVSAVATTSAQPFLQAVVDAVVSAEVLVAVGSVLEVMSAVPFPGVLFHSHHACSDCICLLLLADVYGVPADWSPAH